MNQKIEELLQQSESYDQDHRFMAANDLCSILLEPNNKLDDKTIEKIIQVFIRQLDDTTADTKGNAIKCLVKVISKIPRTLVEELCKKLITNIANPATKEEAKNVDIYATCLKSLINEIPESFADIMCRTLANSGLLKRGNVPEIDEELIELTNHLLKRFSSFLYSHNEILDKQVLAKDLLKNIRHEKASLRKKASLCLGSLSIILSAKEVSSIGEELVNDIIANQQKKELLYYTIGFNSVVKGAGNKLGPTANKALTFILKDIKTKADSQSDDFEFTIELLDYYLSILDNFVKKSPAETKPYLKDIINTLYNLLSYDPNSTLNEDADNNESKQSGYDEEWDDMYDMGDTSWKVRRSAVQLTDTLILTHPELLLVLAETLFDKLVKRFTEQEQNVKLDVFSTLSDFLKAIVYGESSVETEENLEDLLEKATLNRLKPAFAVLSNKLTAMIASLVKVFADKKITAALKAAASGLLLRATKCTPDTTLNHLDSIIKLIEANFSQSSNPTELRSNMLQTLRAILKVQISQSKPQIENYYARIYKLITLALEDQNFKVSSEGYKALTVFYKALRPSLSLPASNFSVYIKPVIPTVVKTLKETDIDEEIKYAVTLNAVALISVFGDTMSAADLTKLFNNLLLKIKAEMKRQQTLKALSLIPAKDLDFPEETEFYNLLGTFITELSNLLKKQDRTLRILGLEVIRMILDIFKHRLPQNIQSEVLRNISPLIKDEDLQLAQLALDLCIAIMNIPTSNPTQYNEVITNCVLLSKSPMVRGNVLDKLKELFTLIAVSDIIDTPSLLERLMADINKASLVPTSSCVTAVLAKIRSVINPYFPKFIDNLSQNKDTLLQQLSLLAIGEFGRSCDLSGDKKLFESVLALFKSQDEELKQHAAVAYGKICLGNIKRCLPVIIQLINQKKDDQYLLLTSLREIVTLGSVQVYEILKEQQFIKFLFDYSETPNQNLRPIVAECIGKMASHDIPSYKDLILSNLKSTNVHRKNTIALAFRYLCKRKEGTQDIMGLIEPFFALLSESDLNIKKAVLESLNSIAHSMPKPLQLINPAFESALSDACKYKPELVKEIELGPFKYMVDEGLAMRTLAFNFIDTGMEYILDKVGINYIVDQILLGITDPADDVQIVSFQILNKVIGLAPLSLFPYVDRLVDKFGECTTKFDKAINAKQEGERVKDCIRAFMRAIYALSKIEEISSLPKFKGFYDDKIAKNEKFKELYEQAASS